MLLANHGQVVAGKSLEDAVYNAGELEETAISPTCRSTHARRVTSIQGRWELEAAFPN